LISHPIQEGFRYDITQQKDSHDVGRTERVAGFHAHASWQFCSIWAGNGNALGGNPEQLGRSLPRYHKFSWLYQG
jgi:hypothetical protein